MSSYGHPLDVSEEDDTHGKKEGASLPREDLGLMNPAAVPPAQEAPNFVLWIVINSLVAVFCQGWLTGIPGFILAFVGRQQWGQGLYKQAQIKLKWSKILAVSWFVIVGLTALVTVLLSRLLGNNEGTIPSY